jgi:hypothetical protein
MKFPFVIKDKPIQANFDYIARKLSFNRELRGQVVAVGTGATFIDFNVTDNLGTASKFAVALQSLGGSTYAADAVVISVLFTTSSTVGFRLFTRGGAAIPVGNTVLVNYVIWT